MPDLSQFLAASYNHAVNPAKFPDRAAECAWTIGRAELQAKRRMLQQVAVRDHVSRVHLGFVDRVLALPPEAPRPAIPQPAPVLPPAAAPAAVAAAAKIAAAPTVAAAKGKPA